MLLRWLDHLTAFWTGMLVFGLVMSCTVRDYVPVVDFVHWGCSYPALAVGAVPMVVWWAWRRRWTALRCAVLVAVASSVIVWCRPSAVIERRVRGGTEVVFANVCNGWAGADRVVTQVLATDPDIVALVEVGDHAALAAATWQRTHHYHPLPGGMGVMSREPVALSCYRERDDAWRISVVQVGRWRIAIVDIMPHVWNWRGAAFAEVGAVIEATCPQVIVGDFNTPYGSRHFDWLRRHYQSGHTAALGGRETWPQPLPLHAIDVGFVEASVGLRRYRILGNTVSDHCFVQLELGLPDGRR